MGPHHAMGHPNNTLADCAWRRHQGTNTMGMLSARHSEQSWTLLGAVLQCGFPMSRVHGSSSGSCSGLRWKSTQLTAKHSQMQEPLLWKKAASCKKFWAETGEARKGGREGGGREEEEGKTPNLEEKAVTVFYSGCQAISHMSQHITLHIIHHL